MSTGVEAVIPDTWSTILAFAAKGRGQEIKTSTVKRLLKVDNSEARLILDRMQASGYLTEPVKPHQVYVWRITDKGREAIL